MLGPNNEAFPTSLWLACLQYVNCLGELACSPGAAAELPEDSPCLELGVCAFARCAQPGVGAVGLFLGLRLVLPDVRDLRVPGSLVALVGQGDQAGGFQLGPARPRRTRPSCRAPSRAAPRTPTRCPRRDRR